MSTDKSLNDLSQLNLNGSASSNKNEDTTVINASAIPLSNGVEEQGVTSATAASPSSAPATAPTTIMIPKATEQSIITSNAANNEDLNASTTLSATVSGSMSGGGGGGTNTDAILLSMLDAEVHRLKTKDKIQKEGLDRHERDGKRLATLLGMSHDQIENLKGRNERFVTELNQANVTIRSLKEQNETLEKKFRLALEDKEAFRVMNEGNNASGKALLAKAELDSKIQKETIERLRDELRAEKERHAEETSLAEIERRKAFELRVALETRLRSVEQEIGFIQEMRQKETTVATNREYDLSVVVEKLKKEVVTLRGTQESATRTAFESAASSRTENHALSEQVRSLEAELTESRRSSFEKLTRLEVLLKAKAEQLEQQESAAKARENVLESQLQKFITDLRSAQEEVNILADRENTKNMSQVNTIIRLTSELDVASRALADAKKEIEALTDANRRQKVDAEVARETASTLLTNTQREAADRYALKTYELNAALVELRWCTEKLSAAEGRLEATLGELSDEKEQRALEARALRREVEDYRTVVAKLNDHIENNIEYKLLIEQNENLTRQIDVMRNQLTSMNAVVANARVEMSIEENHSRLMAMDQTAAQLARLSALEAERLEARPLLESLSAFFFGCTSADTYSSTIAIAAEGGDQQQLLLGGGGGGGRDSDSAGTRPKPATAPHSGALAGLIAVSNARNNNNNNNNSTLSSWVSASADGATNQPSQSSSSPLPKDVVADSGYLLQKFKAEEAGLHRNIEAFYRRFGHNGSAFVSGSNNNNNNNNGTNNLSSGGLFGTGTPPRYGNASVGGFGANASTAVNASSLPSIPTSRIKKVN